MAVRWAAVTFRETEKRFRRILGYQHLWMLKAHFDDGGRRACREAESTVACWSRSVSWKGRFPPWIPSKFSSSAYLYS